MTASMAAGAETALAFELNDKQYDFVYDGEHKYCAYIGGLGAGKSFAGAVKGLLYTLEHPGSLGTIAAPNYPQLRDSTMRSVFQVFPKSVIASFNKTDGLLTLTNGSEVMFRSMDDPDNRRGPNLAWFWLDEGPLCGYYAWQVMKGRLRQAGYPQQAWLTGTPKGEDEFFADFENEPKPSHQLYRASTRENLHNLPETFIEDLGYSGRFALQEIEGLFVSFDGLVYEFRPEWHMGDWPSAETRRPALRIGGVDWGFTNPSVALPMWVDGDDRVMVLDEFYQRQVGLAGLSQAVMEFTRKYGIETWYCGPDEPEHIRDLNLMFSRANVACRAVAANDEINAGIETVRRFMEQRKDGTVGLRISARCTNTRTEFRTYSYPSRTPATKRDPQEKPIKTMDHSMDALRYAMHSAIGLLGRRRPIGVNEIEKLFMPASGVGGLNHKAKRF